jgi:putative hydrolase of the HAD superfamily
MSHGVLFDLDETLIDRTASISAYAHRLYSEFDNHIPDERGIFLERFLELDANGYVDRETFFLRLENYFASPRLSRKAISAHFAENAWSNPIIMAGAVEGLQTLRNTGVPIGVVTNGGSINQRRKFANTGLEALIDAIVISEEFGTKKPDPAIFLSACQQLKIDPLQSWFVGDNPALDIAGADSLGLRTIWHQRGIAWPQELPLCYTKRVTTLAEAFASLGSEL